MNHIKTNEEYRYFKARDRSDIDKYNDKPNVKDPDEPFLNKNKPAYFQKKKSDEDKIASAKFSEWYDKVSKEELEEAVKEYGHILDGTPYHIKYISPGDYESRKSYNILHKNNRSGNHISFTIIENYWDPEKEAELIVDDSDYNQYDNETEGERKRFNVPSTKAAFQWIAKNYKNPLGKKPVDSKYAADTSTFDSLNHIQSFQMFEEINLGASRLSRRKLDYDLVLDPEKKEKIINYLMNLKEQPFRSEQILRDVPDWQLKEWWYDYKPINPKRSLYNFVSSVEADFRKLDTGWENMGGSYHTNNKLDYDRRLSTKIKKGINKVAGKPILNVKK